MKTYIFDTKHGAGVPGLPHEVTDEWARLNGLESVLKQAIKNGYYSEKKMPDQPKIQLPKVGKPESKE